MKRLIPILVLLLALVGCQQPQAAAPADLSALTANQETIRTELQALKATVNELRQAAVLLDVSVRQLGSIDLAKLDWTSLTGVLLHSSPPEVSILVSPGECPTDLPRGPALTPRNSHLAMAFYPLPIGTHCLMTEATEAHLATGSTVTVVPGSITTLQIVAELVPQEEGE